MLKKALRLKKSKDIDSVWNSREDQKTELFVCKFIENTYNSCRPCFTFAKKLKLSVIEKNRLKRQIAHAYKEIPETGTVHYDLLFILTSLPKPEKKRYSAIHENLKLLINKIKCQKGS